MASYPSRQHVGGSGKRGDGVERLCDLDLGLDSVSFGDDGDAGVGVGADMFSGPERWPSICPELQALRAYCGIMLVVV